MDLVAVIRAHGVRRGEQDFYNFLFPSTPRCALLRLTLLPSCVVRFTMAESAMPEHSNIRLRFTTREADLVLSDTVPILIPTNFRRYQLSQYVNSQLEFSKPVPLEFLINGTYLRGTLDDYLNENGISGETVLSVEYVRARIPPQYVASYEHDDWVSSVDASSSIDAPPRIVTSSYDGRVRVWNTSTQLLATSTSGVDGGHHSYVKSAKFVSPHEVVSAGFDRTIKLWEYTDSSTESLGELKARLELYGHKAGVESVCAHHASKRLLSASSDHSVGFWSTKKSDAPPAPLNLIPKSVTREGKRRKLNPSISVAQRGPLRLMHGHTAPVFAADFDVRDETVGYSASLDHTVKTWDLESGETVDTRSTNSALFCLEQMSSLGLIAAGSANRDIKMIDPRASAVSVVAMTLKGHKNHVVTLARDPDHDYVLASGSHDGTCRIWDLRSTRSSRDGTTGSSVFTIPRQSLENKAAPVTGEGVKVFGLCWHPRIGILSAGEDKVLQVNSSMEHVT